MLIYNSVYQLKFKHVIKIKGYEFIEIRLFKNNSFFRLLGFYDFRCGVLFFNYQYFFFYFLRGMNLSKLLKKQVKRFNLFNFYCLIFLNFFNWILNNYYWFKGFLPKDENILFIRRLNYLFYKYFFFGYNLRLLLLKKSKIFKKRIKMFLY